MRYLRWGERERGGGGVHPLDWGDCSASGALANPCSRAVIAVNLATTFTESGYLDLPPPFWLDVWLYRKHTHFFKAVPNVIRRHAATCLCPCIWTAQWLRSSIQQLPLITTNAGQRIKKEADTEAEMDYLTLLSCCVLLHLYYDGENVIDLCNCWVYPNNCPYF